ncbi:hypothetical protein JCGZ_24195 [Jatropha curcas]|uniref:Terpene synthase N-terminal domain-containing protein n=1 Tax=Jatropha curcas TaxID=180498 RepID=A0A067K0C7_JATCU|nr:hypothetical protein JCGZ_24195 [Jatropha curcas]
MALQAVLSFPLATSTQFSINSHKKVPYANVFRSIRCVSANVAATDGLVTSRRSANYESTVWDYDLLQSLPNVFERFKDEKGEFKASLCEDVKGMLSMYEASFFGFEGESNIDEAKIFSTKSLMALKTSTSGSFGRKIEHALDMLF